LYISTPPKYKTRLTSYLLLNNLKVSGNQFSSPNSFLHRKINLKRQQKQGFSYNFIFYPVPKRSFWCGSEENFVLFFTFASIVEREFHSLSHLRFLWKLGNRSSVVDYFLIFNFKLFLCRFLSRFVFLSRFF